MVTGSEMVGRPESGVMVWTPAPEILNVIVSAPTWLLASVIAWRNEPAPVSFVLVTGKVEATTKRPMEPRNKTTKIRAHRTFSTGLEYIDFWRRGTLENCVFCAS